ncbi:ABC transporter ATP-binding protein [Rhodopila globiformis]|uniref:ABC transporter ATP-binding protein n=1 Tax=Rhodopila globiformis TaxID=1071 RepID=A0A2S6NNS7_RHOGL|nr:ABC transporter ATP-binding protein [Rhodopila globiformis]PPQ39024.1 ABC transporter ATP-binding protein [Rhodopila globiformis]
MEPLLSVHGLSVSYGRFQALHEISLAVGRGEVVAIIGANGAGKSSLLNAIMGQAGRVSGAIRFAGRDIAALPTPAIVAAGIALVPEGRRLFPSLTVEENLAIGWDLGRRGGLRVAEIYAMFPVLLARRHQRAGQLSGGEQQMAALGRALLADPRLLLCDELSLGLAPRIVDRIYALMPEIRRRGITVVLVEQDISRSLAVCDRFYCLLEGRVVLSGRPAETDRDSIMQHYFGA